MGPKLAIIFNPVGGSAKKGNVGLLKELLSAGGRDVSMFATTAEPGSAKKLALEALKQERNLIMVGGDWTVCQGAEALYEWEQLTGVRRKMAVVPGGTGNLFIDSFGAAVRSVERFVQLLDQGKMQPVDLIELTYKDKDGVEQKRKSIVGTGLGKISDAISDADPKHKRVFGKLTYVAGVTLACLSPSGNDLELLMPDQTVVVKDSLVLFALNVTPPSMPAISPDCDASDGLLEVVALSGTGFGQVLHSASCLAFGRPESSPGYRKFRTSELTIRSQEALRPNIDGDPSEAIKELNFKVLHRAIDVVLCQ
jgi:diacylglycerol kinase family enzyme